MKTQHTGDVTELLPCPFCGGKPIAERMEHLLGHVRVRCQSCAAQVPACGDFVDPLPQAIAAWNRRPASAPALYRALEGLMQLMDPEVAAVSDVGLATAAKHARDKEARQQAACVLAARTALASATPQGKGN